MVRRVQNGGTTTCIQALSGIEWNGMERGIAEQIKHRCVRKQQKKKEEIENKWSQEGGVVRREDMYERTTGNFPVSNKTFIYDT